ncbi:unnamed protein product [Amoebophrya sp. A120]|nr:unnamed protein product [Amoebophrya sp. A120]|eukprot:GSA120T00012369001.1
MAQPTARPPSWWKHDVPNLGCDADVISDESWRCFQVGEPTSLDEDACPADDAAYLWLNKGSLVQDYQTGVPRPSVAGFLTKNPKATGACILLPGRGVTESVYGSWSDWAKNSAWLQCGDAGVPTTVANFDTTRLDAAAEVATHVSVKWEAHNSPPELTPYICKQEWKDKKCDDVDEQVCTSQGSSSNSAQEAPRCDVKPSPELARKHEVGSALDQKGKVPQAVKDMVNDRGSEYEKAHVPDLRELEGIERVDHLWIQSTEKADVVMQSAARATGATTSGCFALPPKSSTLLPSDEEKDPAQLWWSWLKQSSERVTPYLWGCQYTHQLRWGWSYIDNSTQAALDWCTPGKIDCEGLCTDPECRFSYVENPFA